MKTLETRLREAIKSFDTDPPESDYQRGYLAALKELAVGPSTVGDFMEPGQISTRLANPE